MLSGMYGTRTRDLLRDRQALYPSKLTLPDVPAWLSQADWVLIKDQTRAASGPPRNRTGYAELFRLPLYR